MSSSRTGAMGQLAKATGRWTQYIHYDATAKVRFATALASDSLGADYPHFVTDALQAYAQEWYQMALTAGDYKHPHAKLAYQDEWSSGLLCASLAGTLPPSEAVADIICLHCPMRPLPQPRLNLPPRRQPLRRSNPQPRHL